MYILGICGGADTLARREFRLANTGLGHDAASVLIKDGRVVAGIEEERLLRVKHTNLFPIGSIRFCLDSAGIGLEDVDRIGFYLNEKFLDDRLAFQHDMSQEATHRWTARTLLADRLKTAFGVDVGDRIDFVDHHTAHAYSAFPYSKGSSSLVLTVDGIGETHSGTVGRSVDGMYEKLAEFGQDQSLGFLYVNTIMYIGFKVFEEYKVMGLAPYGNPAVYREGFSKLFELRDDGEYRIAPTPMILRQLSELLPGRKKGEEVLQSHKDLAATLQEALETIIFHILAHWQTATGLEHLCIAGGVAHNCTMTGKVMNAGLFKSVYVPPAAHDAGCALGAANYVLRRHAPAAPIHGFANVYWGTPVPANSVIADTLAKWQDWLQYRCSDDVTAETAEYLDHGQVVGWVQGNSEFGPRALGNRSILADPRPAANRARINMMIKKREGFRPFAPSVIAEAAKDYFAFENADALPYMSFIVGVRPALQQQLGAITHVDGTARIQTVEKEDNPRYWQLIESFGRRTGIPMLLNTSFNNNVEPIVDSIEDAIVCYLTTELDVLVIGDFIVTRVGGDIASKLAGASVKLVAHGELQRIHSGLDDRQEGESFVRSSLTGQKIRISEKTYEALRAAILYHSGGPLPAEGWEADPDVLEQLRMLWENRLVRVEPHAMKASAPVRVAVAAA